MMAATHCPRCGVCLVHFLRRASPELMENVLRCPACSFHEMGAVEPGAIEVEDACVVRIAPVAEVTVAQLRALRDESQELAHCAPADLRARLITTGCNVGPYWRHPEAREVAGRLTRAGLRCEVQTCGEP